MDIHTLKPSDFEVSNLGEPKFASPLEVNTFTHENERFLFFINESEVQEFIKSSRPMITIEKAGPRELLFFDPKKTRAGIVTCGGLCPGINNVIQAITTELLLQYNIPKVLGYQFGFKGIADNSVEPVNLDLDNVADISELGGSILGSSRGPQEVPQMVDRLIKDDISILFVIGGDGSLKGAEALQKEILKRNLQIAIVGVPKTIDNDLNFISKSFGFETAYSKAVESIKCAHTESKGYENGIGIVKVMGRHSGAIAASATIASTEANFCLIPEVPFELEGPNGLLEEIKERLLSRHHAVIVIAEGAAQDLISGEKGKDPSGNLKLKDSGIWLRDEIKDYFNKIGMETSIKYIDPSYIIRSIPAIPSDSLFCTILGQYAAHAGMSGRTGCVIGQWNHYFAILPIHIVVSSRKIVNTRGSIWSSVLETTGQHFTIR